MTSNILTCIYIYIAVIINVIHAFLVNLFPYALSYSMLDKYIDEKLFLQINYC